MKKATLKIFGNVLDILEGRVASDRLRPVDQAHFRFALGGASFSNPKHIGETLLIEGVPHIFWVENGIPRHGTQSNAWSPFLMGIDYEQEVGPFQHCPSTPISLELLYGDLAHQYPMGFALAASFHMAEFKGTYLKKPPIYHENINQHHEEYWSLVETHSSIPIYLFGVVVPSAAKRVFSEEILQRAFYQNPRDTPHLFDSHTHAAIVDKIIQAKDGEQLLQGFKKLQIKSVWHTLTQSVIQEGSYILFPLGQVE